jgi:hypothetical protein
VNGERSVVFGPPITRLGEMLPFANALKIRTVAEIHVRDVHRAAHDHHREGTA